MADVTYDDLDRAAETVLDQEPDTSQDVSLESEVLDSAPDPAKSEEEETDVADPTDELEAGAETDPTPDPVEPEEPDDHGERSRLGRRVKNVEDTMQNIQELQSNIYELLQKDTNGTDVDGSVLDDDDTDNFEFVTKKDFEDLMSKREDRKVQETQKYEAGYLQRAAQLGGDMTEAEHLEIITEMNANHGIRHSDNARADAETNFRNAEIAVLRKKIAANAKPKNPLDKNKGKVPENLGGPSGDDVEPKQPPVPKLDAAAQEFVNKMGLSEKQVANALSGDAPLSLFGGSVVK